nr:transposon Ty3-I Gag-Pol polyprotein [Tanacetum cinerariifolium]
MVTDLEDSKTHTVGEVWSSEYMDHGCTKSMSELDMRYTMLQELRSVIVGGALIHKNHEGSQHEGRRICPTIGNFRGNCASNQSPFNNGRIKEREEEKNEVRVSTTKIFHLKLLINNSVFFLIIDGCSINNLVSRELVNFLKLPMEICPIEGCQVCRVLATIEKSYKVEVLCIVDDIDECHILLGRLWRYVKRKSIKDKVRRKVFDVVEAFDIENSRASYFRVRRIHVDETKVNAVRNWSLPKTLPDVRNIKVADAFQEEDELEYAKPLDGEAEKVTYVVQRTLCSPKHYNDLVTCDVDIKTCHVLLERPWQHDMDVIHQDEITKQTLATLVASPKEFQAERKETGVSYAFVVKGVKDFMENAIPTVIKPLLAEFGKIVTDDAPDALPPLRNIQHQIDLSRKTTLLVSISNEVLGFNSFKELYASDEDFCNTRMELKTKQHQENHREEEDKEGNNSPEIETLTYHVLATYGVLPGRATYVLIPRPPPPPQCTHNSGDVEKLKKKNKYLTKQVNLVMKLFRSENKFSQMLNQYESTPEFGNASGSGGCGNDEMASDEDGDEDEEDDDS